MIASTVRVTRTAFRTSRLLDFLSKKELVAQIGHAATDWPLVVLKELIDNALDACEEARVPPEISVVVDDHGITVTDNGPGIPADVVRSTLDYSIRVSTREAYVSPDRGAQGNALKTIVAMPFVLSGDSGRVEITACGIRHEIEIRVDRLRQKPDVCHVEHPVVVVKNGTSVRVHWPNLPRSTQAAGGSENLQEPTDELLEESGWDNGDLPSLILGASKSRFLQIADDFRFLNPHLRLTTSWHGEINKAPAHDPAWPKWGPSEPTSAHWYGLDHFERLVTGYIAHDQDRGADRTVRELLSEFRGLTSTVKQKTVLNETGLARTYLSALAADGAIDRQALVRLLTAMKRHTKPVKPIALGVIGKDHVAARFKAIGCKMDTFTYKRVIGESDGVPWIVETAFGGCPEAEHRRIVTGVNWSPGIVNPFRQLGRNGRSLDSILEQQRAGQDEPVVLLLHLACPRVEFADRGKSSIVVED